MNDFQNDTRVKVALLSIQAAGVGLTLTVSEQKKFMYLVLLCEPSCKDSQSSKSIRKLPESCQEVASTMSCMKACQTLVSLYNIMDDTGLAARLLMSLLLCSLDCNSLPRIFLGYRPSKTAVTTDSAKN